MFSCPGLAYYQSGSGFRKGYFVTKGKKALLFAVKCKNIDEIDTLKHELYTMTKRCKLVQLIKFQIPDMK